MIEVSDFVDIKQWLLNKLKTLGRVESIGKREIDTIQQFYFFQM